MKKLSPTLMAALRFVDRGDTITYSIAKTLEIKGLIRRGAVTMWEITERGKAELKTEQGKD